MDRFHCITSYNKTEEQREGKVRQMLHISRLVFVQHKNKKRIIIMEKPNYMDIKKIADFTISRIAIDILKAYTDESITEYLEKYSCDNVKELIYLILCEVKPNDLNISLNMRQKIKNLSEEINEEESQEQQRYAKVVQLSQEKDTLVEKVQLLQIQQNELLQKVQEVVQINKALKMKLQKNSSNQPDL